MQRPIYTLRPFPRGWDSLFDVKTGRTFYIDYINKRTSWIDPRDSPARDREPHELPFAWSTEEDPRIGTYFMDNIGRIATKVDPRTGRELPINPRPPSTVTHPPRRHDDDDDDGISTRQTSQSSRSQMSTPDMRTEDIEKLARVMKEFEENEILLMREGDRILAALVRAGADESAIMSLPRHQFSDTDERDLMSATAQLDEYLTNHDGNNFGTHLDGNRELFLEEHLQRLHQFINEQHSNLALLHKLERTVNLGGDIYHRLSSGDNMTLSLLQQLIQRGEGRTTPQHQTKIVYFRKLIECAKLHPQE